MDSLVVLNDLFWPEDARRDGGRIKASNRYALFSVDLFRLFIRSTRAALYRLLSGCAGESVRHWSDGREPRHGFLPRGRRSTVTGPPDRAGRAAGIYIGVVNYQEMVGASSPRF